MEEVQIDTISIFVKESPSIERILVLPMDQIDENAEAENFSFSSSHAIKQNAFSSKSVIESEPVM